MSLRDADWWILFVTRLQEESLDSLARELAVSADDLLAALLESGSSAKPQETFWWPEVLRMHEAESPVERIADRFKLPTAKLAVALGVVPTPSAHTPKATSTRELTLPKVTKTKTKTKTKLRRHAKATNALPKPRTQENVSPTRRSGRKRFVRPDAIAEEFNAEGAAPPKPKRRRKKKPDSLHGAVIEVDPSKLDLSDLLPPPPADQPHLEPLPESRKMPVQFLVPKATASEPTTEVVEPVAELFAEPVVEPVAELFAELFAELIAEPVAEPTVELVAELYVEPVAEPVAEWSGSGALVSASVPPSVVAQSGPSSVLGWRIRVDGIEQAAVVVAPDIVTAACRFRDLLGVSALQCADLYPTPLLTG